MAADPLAELLAEVRACELCIAHLPHGVRPVLQCGTSARILIAGQAPGRRVHASGIPFDDPSGERLRDWMGIGREQFYDPARIAILPMGFCYPGSGRSGDLPPRAECAPAWRERLLAQMPHIELVLLLGQHAQRWHLGRDGKSLTERVRDWSIHWPGMLPLPHPSPRNIAWFQRNPWFDHEVVPALRDRVNSILQSGGQQGP